MCAVTILVGRGSPELQQVRLLVRFSLKRLRFSLCTHTYVLLYSDALRCPGDNSIKLGRTDASRQNLHTYIHVPILMYCCTRMHYVALAIILSNSGERMHRDRIPPQRMHAAYRIVTRGSCCTKRFAAFNGNCESLVVHGRRVMYCPRI